MSSHPTRPSPDTAEHSLVVPRPRRRARMRLYCFPHAGASAALYAPWAEQLPEEIELCGVELPGRGRRYFDPRLPTLVDEARAAAALLEREGMPCALFGHSFGAIVAFEVARSLEVSPGQLAQQLFVSGSPGPRGPFVIPALRELTDPEIVVLLRELGGTPEAVLAAPELLRALWPTLRADLEALRAYRYRPTTLLGLPITVYGGREDSIARSTLEAWRAETSESARVQLFAGGHFFVKTSERALLAMLAAELRYLAARCCAAPAMDRARNQEGSR